MSLELDLVLRHQEFTQPYSLELYPHWYLQPRSLHGVCDLFPSSYENNIGGVGTLAFPLLFVLRVTKAGCGGVGGFSSQERACATILALGTGVEDGLPLVSRSCLLCAVGHLLITTLGATPFHLHRKSMAMVAQLQTSSNFRCPHQWSFTLRTQFGCLLL